MKKTCIDNYITNIEQNALEIRKLVKRSGIKTKSIIVSLTEKIILDGENIVAELDRKKGK
jgi:Tfp pilus assembly PilM family ATPase